MSRVAALWDPSSGTVQIDAAQAAASSRGMRLQILKVEELGNQLVWETRIFEDRRRVIKFVCEVPTAIDQRLGQHMRAVLTLIREQHQINGPDGGEIALAEPFFADQAAQHVAELLHLGEALAASATSANAPAGCGDRRNVIVVPDGV